MEYTATVEVLTAEVRVLMVGSRQVTLSVYRQLDRRPSDEVEPFGRVSDKQDEPKYGCRSVFVVGCDASGALVRSRHSVRTDPPERHQELVNRRSNNDYDGRRDYGNDLRQSVEPFTEERRVGDRRGKKQRRSSSARGGVWMWAENVEDFQPRLSTWEEAGSKHDEWTSLPLIVLAGLR